MSCSLKVKLQPIIAQFDLVLFASLFFISPICVAWSLSGSTHFESQYNLFIVNFVLITWSLDKEEQPIQLPEMNNSMDKSQYAYWASLLSWNEPTHQAGQKIYIIRNYKIRSEFVHEIVYEHINFGHLTEIASPT